MFPSSSLSLIEGPQCIGQACLHSFKHSLYQKHIYWEELSSSLSLSLSLFLTSLPLPFLSTHPLFPLLSPMEASLIFSSFLSSSLLSSPLLLSSLLSSSPLLCSPL